MSRIIVLLFLVMGLALSVPTYAQDENDTNPDMGAARNDVRISQLEEQMRKLQGTLEQLSFQNNQLKAQLDKQATDQDFRLTALEKKQAAVAVAQPVAAANAPVASPVEDASAAKPAPDAIPESDSPAVDDTKLKPVSSAVPQKFNNPHDLYTYALKALQQSQYDEASNAFITFTKQYPKDPLIGNAYYWLGESYYARHDYVKAADSFRQGYESVPTGPKAGDNLLKLGMSLDAQSKDKEACIVFRRVVKFASASSTAKSMSEQEINRLGCAN